MKIIFDKDQWEIDSESLHPIKEIKRHNYNRSILGYGLVGFIAFVMFIFFIILSPIIILNSIKVLNN